MTKSYTWSLPQRILPSTAMMPRWPASLCQARLLVIQGKESAVVSITEHGQKSELASPLLGPTGLCSGFEGLPVAVQTHVLSDQYNQQHGEDINMIPQAANHA